MKQAEHSNWKATFDIRKRPINGKLFQNQKINKDEFILNPKKTLGKKYMQQSNIFKQRQDQPKKQHRQIVMSEEFIRSSKLYRLLKQKMDRCDSMFVKQVNCLTEHKLKLKDEIMQIKSQNYQEKIGLWQLKNKFMELKAMYQEEEQESKRLTERNFAQYEGEQEMELGEQNAQQGANDEENEDTEEQYKQSQNQYVESENKLEIHQHKQIVEVKKEFSQILEELMNLKAQRQKIEQQFSEESQNQKQQKEFKTESFFQQQNQKQNHQYFHHSR